MDRKEFTEKFHKASDEIDKEAIMKVLKESIDSNIGDGNPRGHRNLIIAIEEMAELQKELSKELRGKGDITNIVEELADVKLGILWVQEVCGIDDKDLNKAMNVKIDRLNNKLKETGHFY